MPDYRETTVDGKTWRRAFAVHLNNPLDGGRGIIFEEEDVFSLGSMTMKKTTGNVGTAFDPAGSFPLINPDTGEDIGNMGHIELYVALHSLYIHLAKARDEALFEANPAGG